MISFLSPLFLAGAAAIAIPIAIHLFYRRLEPVIDFAATRYLRRAPVEQSERRRLRELILLAVRVTALVLLALAFARPFLSQSAAALSAPATVVLVDTSASVSAPGQFDRARARARQVLRDAPAGQAVGVVAFGSGATVVAPLSQDRAGALAAVARLTPGSGATRYRAALARAAEELGDRPGTLVVVTDLQQTGWDTADQGAVPERIAVSVESIEGPSANVALTMLRVEGTEAVAVVQNFSPRPGTGEVVFTLDDRRIGAVVVAMPSMGSVEARLSVEGQTSGKLVATVTDRDGYAADNARYAVLDTAHAPLILAITASGGPSEAFYLQRALAIAEGAGGFRFRTLSGQAFSDLDPQALGEASVVTILGTRGLEQRGRELLGGFVSAGGGVLVAAGPDVDPAIVNGALGEVVRTTWRTRDARELRFAPGDSRHPVFRLFGGSGTLGNVSFARSALIDVADTGDVVARYSDGSPALVEERTGAGRVLLFASDLNDRWNDFPLQPAFVPFVHETLRYLASPRNARTEYLVGDLPGVEGLTPGVIALTRSSVGRALAGSPPGTLARWGASGSPGGPDKVRPTSANVNVNANVNAERRVAINVDPRESDPARMSADDFRAGVSRLNASAARLAQDAAREQEDSQQMWQYVLLLMVVGLAAEGMLGRRLG